MAKPSYKTKRRERPAAGKPTGKPSRRKPKAETPKPAPVAPPPRPRPARRSGDRLPAEAGLLIEVASDSDYALVDSGDGEKLERYNGVLIRRPENQAAWTRTLPAAEWAKAQAVFTGDDADEGRSDRGRWAFPHGVVGDGETFPMRFDGLAYHGRFTAFRHTGVFPEQAAHWRSMEGVIKAAKRPVTVLNLFGYTGLASLVAARAGAQVTHVDASKKAIQQARENADLAGLTDAPIRWICDDAVKFCEREVRRGNGYDIILLDPPAYGRGPKGEVWQLFDDLPHMLDLVRDMQSTTPLMTVLTSYAIRSSHLTLIEAMQDAFAGMTGRLDGGELVLAQETGGRSLSTSMFARYIAPGVAP
ncbi:MAG: class I SAM-dependent methyltransferase [Pseudomonadota bacterium]